MSQDLLKKKKSVFVSHASKNFAIADNLRALLEGKGIQCWIAPRDIDPGASYASEISTGIESCSVTVLILTSEANESKAVANELELSFAKQKVIIPVRLSDIKPSKDIEFFVSNAQWIDALYSPLRDRVEDIIRVVLAVEQRSPIPIQSPERRTLLGLFYKKIEQDKKFTLLLIFLVLIALTVIGLVSYQSIGKIEKTLDKQQLLIDQDPSILGLITARLSTESEVPISKNLLVKVTIYSNLKNTPNTAIGIGALVVDGEKKRTYKDLKKLLTDSQIQDAQTLDLLIPDSIESLHFCFKAPHPNSGKPVFGIWSYTLKKQGEVVNLEKAQSPKLVEKSEIADELCNE
jgi:hypothetical protein